MTIYAGQIRPRRDLVEVNLSAAALNVALRYDLPALVANPPVWNVYRLPARRVLRRAA